MKKESIVLIMLLALSTISMIPLLFKTTNAYPVVQTPLTNPKIIEWYPTSGYNDYLTMAWNPEYLKVVPLNAIYTNTTIIVEGTDVYGQNIEARAVIPGSPDNPAGPVPGAVQPELTFILNDTHTDPPRPVAFATITRILQQNGTDNDKYEILTEPEPFEEYLGQFHNSTGYQPGIYNRNGDNRKYLVGQGENVPYTVQNVPVEPSNPDPLKIAVNWVDMPNLLGVRDLLPTTGNGNHYPPIPASNEFPNGGNGQPGAQAIGTLWIEGLDEAGHKLIQSVTITPGQMLVNVDDPPTDPNHTFSTVCKVWGGNQVDSYYIFTEPKPERALFYYYLLIDHITIHPASYDILAYPLSVDTPAVGSYPGVENITIALRDIDGNLINANNYGTATGGIDKNIVVNFYTSGGKIQPSNDLHIYPYHITATANLTADTNPRTITVTADINVPICTWHPELNLWAYTEITFDGVNSVGFQWGTSPIHKMMWGYTNSAGARVDLPVPAKPVLPPELGGPDPTVTGTATLKFDGPIYEVQIPIEVGCNLVSSPVYPIMANYYSEAYPTVDNHQGIPMELLFGKTSSDSIESVWWYIDGSWQMYIPGVTTGTYFTDGVGYWIKADKPCTLEISGVAAENAPFTPAEYTIYPSWNLVGFTSITALSPAAYLESLSVGPYNFYGPLWLYSANPFAMGWTRDPAVIYPTQAFWVYYKPNELIPSPIIAP